MSGKTADLTLAAWANIPTVNEKGCLVHVGAANGSDGYSLGIGNTSFDNLGNNLIFEACPNQWTVLGPISGTGWHHLAAIIDSAGAVTGTIDGAAPVPVTTPPLLANPAAYVAQQRGQFIHFNMATFVGADLIDPFYPPSTFSPTALNVSQWIDVAVGWGAKYAVLTIKHDDGFCLWPTTTTTQNVSNSSWYAANGHPDIVQMFCDACRAAGVLPCFYFNIGDRNWTVAHPGYINAQFKTFTEGQITEILTRYAPVAAIWLDSTEWIYGDATPWASSAARSAFIHGVHPGIMIIDNGHTGNPADGDIMEFEIPVQLTPPSGNPYPSEGCTTIASTWFWESDTQTLSDALTLADQCITCNANNASFLLNIPPNSTGIIPAQFIAQANLVRRFLADYPGVLTPNRLTSNTSTAPFVVSASSEWPGYEAYHAFNPALALLWSSNGTLPQWIQIDFGSSQTASHYAVQARRGTVANQWTAWTLSGSNDGGFWTVVDTRTQATIAAGDIRVYDLSAAQTYRYWRWTITASATGTAGADCGPALALYA